MTAFTHGTLNGYSNHGCRCDPCRLANTAYGRIANARRRAKGLAEGDPRHGTAYGYEKWGCRCGPCRTVRRAVVKQRRQQGSERARVLAQKELIRRHKDEYHEILAVLRGDAVTIPTGRSG